MSAESFATADERFWLVWRDGAGPPTRRHRSETDAYAEAGRLAAIHPGARFLVLAAIGEVVGHVVATARTLDPVALMRRAPEVTIAPLDCRPGPIQLPNPARVTLGDPPPGAAYDYRPEPHRAGPTEAFA